MSKPGAVMNNTTATVCLSVSLVQILSFHITGKGFRFNSALFLII